MGREWLWDRKITDDEVKKILADERHERFVDLAALLLARHNAPKVVFGEYLDRVIFVRQWAAIKRAMRRNLWNDPRIIFWQAVYEKLRTQLKDEGVTFSRRESSPGPVIAVEAGKMIRDLRGQVKLTQGQLAQRMGVSQQVISRVEKGVGNVSIVTLERIISALGKHLRLYSE